jgi:starch synthase (maltosyl-transferring)
LDNTPWNGREEFNDSEKYEVKKYDWKKTNRMTDIMTLLNKARKENAALQSTWNIHFLPIENPNLLAFIKVTDDLSSIVLTIINLDQHNRQNGYVQVPKALLKLSDHVNIKMQDVITEENYTWTQEWNFVEIDPYKIPFHLFVVKVSESNM